MQLKTFLIPSHISRLKTQKAAISLSSKISDNSDKEQSWNRDLRVTKHKSTALDLLLHLSGAVQ